MSVRSAGRNETATITRWSRAFVAIGIGLFPAWHLGVASGLPRAATVPIGVFGFVLFVVFGTAYTLVPAYFAREPAVPRAPAVHLPLAVVGVACLAAAGAGVGPSPSVVAAVGAASWLAGCLVFVGATLLTVRGNVAGRETGTGSSDRHRRRTDRLANAAVPIVLGYLLVGSTVPVAAEFGLEPPILPTVGPGVTHLFAAGTAALLVFAVGFRLLPRLLVATPRYPLVAMVLTAGVVGPALLAAGFPGGTAFRVGAGLQTLALVGFAVSVVDLSRQSDRDRVGTRAFLGAACSAAGVAVLGLAFAFDPASSPSLPATAADAHYRLAVGGFLGLMIVGVTAHFYPPAIAPQRGLGDRTARVAIVGLLIGLALEVTGLLATASSLVAAGRGLSVLGAVAYALVLWGVFLERAG